MSTTSDRPTLEPTRERGKQRVAELLDAGAAVIAEHGFEAATMAEIAAQAGSHVGSLYRFFPNKESLADALVTRYRERMDAAFGEIERESGALSISELADALLDLLVVNHTETRAAASFLDARGEGSEMRKNFRHSVIAHVANALRLRRATLSHDAALDAAVALLQNMKAMVLLTFDAAKYERPGARAQVRAMTRLYLEALLRPE
jgi:AcrR family transcriptional regulator